MSMGPSRLCAAFSQYARVRGGTNCFRRHPSPGRSSPCCWLSSSWRAAVSYASRKKALTLTWRSHVTPLAKLLEAALFAASHPITVEDLTALDEEASPAAVALALDEIRLHY